MRRSADIARLVLVCSLHLSFFMPVTIAAEEISGFARVVDGDTLAIGRTRVRLFGIDAPERDQTCRDENSRRYECGRRAASALSDLVDRRGTVRCLPLDRDRYGRIVVRCENRAVRDIGRAMVERGMAVEFTAYSDGRYGDVEEGARAARRGLWRGDFVMPWEWRSRKHR